MKKISSAAILGLIIAASSCTKSDNNPTPTPPTPVDSTGQVDVRGVIKTDQSWTKGHVYRLRGYVYVTDGAKITIEAGTKIISNKDSAGVLVIYRDATIDAPFAHAHIERADGGDAIDHQQSWMLGGIERLAHASDIG